MKNVKVLLRENVKDLGQFGDVVHVAAGYARNYLFPQRLAVEATPDNVKMIERRRARYEASLAEREAEVSARIERQCRTCERGTAFGWCSRYRIRVRIRGIGVRQQCGNIQIPK